MYAMNIHNDVIGLVLRENCTSKQVIDFIAWPSRCHGRIQYIPILFVLNFIFQSLFVPDIVPENLPTSYPALLKCIDIKKKAY